MTQRIPMPGDTDVVAGTIVASSFDVDADPQPFYVLILNATVPYYTVARIVEEHENGEGVGVWTFLDSTDHENIVPAAEDYQEVSGAWGGA